MNEGLRKNAELNETELEDVTGGARVKPMRDGLCAVCGANAYNQTLDGEIKLVCSLCGHAE